MNPALHVLKKDLRHSRVMLAVWLLLVILQCALIGSTTNPADPLMQALFAILGKLLPIFQFLVLVVIIPQVVQDEPLVGTTAFWFTRPISRANVLKSKSLFALLLLILPPLLAQVIVLAANRVTGHDIALAAPQILLGQLYLVVVVGILAALTPNFGRFAILGAVVLVAMALLQLAIFWIMAFVKPDSVVNRFTDQSMSASRSVAGSVLVIFFGAAVIAHQYLTRNTRRTIIGAATGLVLYLAIGMVWPWNFMRRKAVNSSDSNFDSAAITASFEGNLNVSDIGTIRGQGEPDKSVMAEIRKQGVPRGYVINVEDVHSNLFQQDGRPVTVKPGQQTMFYSGVLNHEAIEFALGGISIVSNQNFSGPEQNASLFTINADTYNQLETVPLRYSGTIDLSASRYVVSAEMPLVKGSRYDHGSEHIVITDLLKQPQGLNVLLRQRTVNLLFKLDAERNPYMPFGNNGVVYLLVNRKRGEAILPKQDNNFTFNISAGSQILVNEPVRLSFVPEANDWQWTTEITPEWLANATLVRLDLVRAATFSKKVDVNNFSLNEVFPNQMSNMGRIGPDLNVLDKIALPANPTRQQVKDYIFAIAKASRPQNTRSTTDPQIAMLEKIGPDNLDLFMEFEQRAGYSSSLNYYNEPVIKDLARPQHKALILDALQRDSASALAVVDLVVKFGWQADARDTLVSRLRRQPQGLPDSWIKAVASLHDPATYPVLKACLAASPWPMITLKDMEDVPGLDLSDTVDQIWKRAQAGTFTNVTMDTAEIAAEYGHLDALDLAAHVLATEPQTNDTAYQLFRAHEIIVKFTPATGDNKALAAWVQNNRGKLVFDPASKKYLPRN